MSRKYDYATLEREFITTDVSLRAMAKREGMSNGTLSEVARRPDSNGKTWLDKRREYQDEVERRYLASSAESRARQLSDLQDQAVTALQMMLVRLGQQLAGDEENGVEPMEVSVRDGIEAMKLIQVLRGQPSNISEERRVVGHLADPRLLELLGDLAERRLRSSGSGGEALRALPGPVERPA